MIAPALRPQPFRGNTGPARTTLPGTDVHANSRILIPSPPQTSAGVSIKGPFLSADWGGKPFLHICY